jgi:outer membrane protein insertion porin family
LDRPNRIGAYEQAVVLDLRDNPATTHEGLYSEVRVIEGTPFAGGDFSFVELVPELRGYVPLGGVVFAGKARYGTFIGDAPVTERFVSGGASNHRGFGERKLSPFVTDGSTTIPIGGTTLVETGVEARIPLTTWRKMGVGTVVFLDGGDVTDDNSSLSLSRLHWALGGGLRLNTIVGPVRFDLGYRLNRTGPMDPAPGSHYAFHFSIGEAF